MDGANRMGPGGMGNMPGGGVQQPGGMDDVRRWAVSTL